MTRLTSVIVALAVVSCSSGGSSSGLSPAARAKWAQYCDYRAACGSTPCDPVECVAAYAESGPLIEFVDCQSALACGSNDDACTASAGTTDAERQAFTARCEAMLNANNETTPTCYTEPIFCTIIAYPLIRKDIMQAVDACLPTASCPDRMACIEAVTAPLSCN